MAQVLLRQAEPRDGDAIAHVHTTSMREALPYLPELHTDDETREWVATVVLPNQEVWVAETEDGQVIGVAALHEGVVGQLYMLPGYQGLGIGSRLLDKMKELSPGGLNLWAFQRNMRARGFYERRGFVAVEFGDGSGNEEGEPDVRYEWRPRSGDEADV